MSFSEGIHFILDCKLNDTEFLNNSQMGIAFINLIINKLNLNLLMPLILVNFPDYNNFKGIKNFSEQHFENKINYIDTSCFKDYKKDNISGYSLSGIISESHITIHTFPEENYFSFDLYSCTKFDTELLINIFKEEIKYIKLDYKFFKRGI